jgi:hypothetical protein
MEANPNQLEEFLIITLLSENESASLKSPNGARGQAEAEPDRKKIPKTRNVSGAMSNQARMSLSPSHIQTVTVGPGVPPGHASRGNDLSR